ncbi:peroxiredoxin family protein [Bacillus sp. SG-1]|uniref:peroxiredoxin family protein n=1 Tax=Bacillus sp. SG-1 TaxID=161544 RepID=UPI001E28C7A6|nr:TlpA disulfide reductase family protein [Bacillus sp. SG-1]
MLMGTLLIFLFMVVIYTENKSLPVMYEFKNTEEVLSNDNAATSLTQEEVPDRLPGPKLGTMAPDFTLQTLTGETISLADLKGEKVLINFWAAWCTPCTQELPALEEFNKTNQDIKVISINIDPEDHAEEFARDAGISFPVLLDEDDKVNEDYQVISIPTTMLIDEKGYVINKHIGALDEEGFHVFVQ